MTNPLSHKCDNYSEPDQLRGDSDSKKYVSKYKQLLIPFCKLINNCSQFLRKCSFFLFIFEMIYIGVWMLHLGTDFSCKKKWAPKTQWWPIDMIKEKIHIWNIDLFFGERLLKSWKTNKLSLKGGRISAGGHGWIYCSTSVEQFRQQ